MANEDYLKQGIDSFKNGKLDDALKLLDKALEVDCEDRKALNTRAAVLEKIGALGEALKCCKRVIDLAPSSWQGYGRSARVFLKMNKPDPALKMIDFALERMPPPDAGGQARRAEMEQLRTDARALARSLHRRSLFDLLPAEILFAVFGMLAASTSPCDAIRQGLVCRRWRDVVCGMPALWDSLVLRPKTPQRKIDTWLERSRGGLRAVALRDGFSFEARPDVFRRGADGMWERLEGLEIVEDSGVGQRGSLPAGVLDRLHLRKLSVVLRGVPFLGQLPFVRTPGYRALLERACSQSLQSLQLSTYEQINWEPIHACRDLTELLVRCAGISLINVLPILSNNPSLQTLSLHDVQGGRNHVPSLEEGGQPVELPRLRSCSYAGLETGMHRYFALVRTPNLTQLSVSDVRHNTRFLSALCAVSLPELEQFALAGSRVDDAGRLVRFLRNAPRLRRLEFRGCFPVDVNLFVDGLASGGEGGAGAGPEPEPELELVCPLLEEIDLSTNQFLRSATLMRLTRTRTRTAEEGDESPGRCLVRCLDISACEAVESSALPWLRSRIAKVKTRTKGRSRAAYGGMAYTLV